MQSNDEGRTPKKIQKDEAPVARRKHIQTNEALADIRQGRPARFDAIRIEIRALITEISHAADVELLDLLADETGLFARYKAAQDARTWSRPPRSHSKPGSCNSPAQLSPSPNNEEQRIEHHD
ncbi:hypothetical protein OWT26_27085 [Burkholderia sp. 1A5]